MNIIVWNVRGLNDPIKQKAILGRIRDLQTNLVFLLETRVKEHNMQNIVSRHLQGWRILHNYFAEARNGRIWCLWNSLLQVELIDSMDQSITCGVTYGDKKFYFSAVYGSNEGIERRRLWMHLASLRSSIAHNPWMLAGDFNIIMHPSESSNFNGSQGANVNMKEFMDTVNDLAVFDHAFIGPLFTWSNHQDDTFLARKLDRVLINDDWHIIHAHSTVEFLTPEVLDHCPAFIKLENEQYSYPKPFRFFNYWVKHQEFQKTVAASWTEPMKGSPMVVLHRKLKRLKQCLKTFNRNFYSDISMKVKAKREELAKV